MPFLLWCPPMQAAKFPKAPSLGLGAHALPHPKDSMATVAGIPFHGLTGKERIILGLIVPELIEFTFPSAREVLP